MPVRSPISASAAAALIASAAVVAGCGGSSGGSDPSMGAQSGSAGAAATPAPAAASTGPAVQSATVDIRSFTFKPVTIVVKKGGRVRWTNNDAAAHTATADDRSFDTQTIDKGSAKAITLTKAGTFSYHCDFHPFMKATVVVK
jgi:plastocyanin